jgi:putative SOS response-associated peptidase YedK
MCGRVRLSSDYSEIKIALKFDPDAPAPNFARDWNLPPTAPMLVAIRCEDGKRIPKMMRWGLLPAWAKDEKLSYTTFNARSEEFTTKPAFKNAWTRGQRCLVVTDGFCEWKKLDPSGKKKQPYAIAMQNGPMVMAGLWEKWKDPKSGNEVLSCTILTCRPNKVMAELHDHMPVILAENDWPKWLGEKPTTEEELLALLKPCPDDVLKIWPVDKAVGNVKNMGPQLLNPVAAGPYATRHQAERADRLFHQAAALPKMRQPKRAG